MPCLIPVVYCVQTDQTLKLNSMVGQTVPTAAGVEDLLCCEEQSTEADTRSHLITIRK